MARIQSMKWVGLDKYKKNLQTLQKNKVKLVNEYLKEFEELTLKAIKQAAPRATGSYANSWRVVKRGDNFIEIDTSMPNVFNWLENGTKPHEILARNVKYMHFYWDRVGEEVWFKRVMHPGTKAQPHIIHISRLLDDDMWQLVRAKLKRHWKTFDHIGMSKQSNLTKTVGLTGTHRSTLRGRGKISLIRVRTGRKQFKRRLGRRRRTGQFIKKADVG